MGYGAVVFLHEGNSPAALQLLNELPASYTPHGEALLRACLERRSPSDIEGISRQAQLIGLAHRDPEQKHNVAAAQAFCGRAAEAIELLKQAIGGKYCSYPALTTDPLFASIRGHRDFPALVSAGRACQERFETYRRRLNQ